MYFLKMKNLSHLILVIGCLFLLLQACAKSPLENEEQIQDLSKDSTAYIIITTPENGASFDEGDNIDVKIDAQHTLTYDSVDLWIDDAHYATLSELPFHFTVASLLPGEYIFEAKAYINDEINKVSESISVVVEEAISNSGSYNGSIIATDQGTGIIYLLDPDKTNLNDGILWSLLPNELKGLADGEVASGGGADAKWVLGGTHLLAICSPYIALIRIEDKTAVFYAKNGGGNPHSVELLPDGNIVSANSDGNSLKLFATGKGNGIKPIEVSFGGAHGAVWDHNRQLLWAIGGDKLWAFTYNFNKDNPMLTPVNSMKYVIEPSGHDLYPVPGEDKLYFTSKNLWMFDIATGEQTVVLDKGPKSVSQNGPGGEIIYTQGMGNNAAELGIKKWQTPHIKSLNGTTRTFEGAAFYKARWFIPCPFIYPDWEYEVK